MAPDQVERPGRSSPFRHLCPHGRTFAAEGEHHTTAQVSALHRPYSVTFIQLGAQGGGAAGVRPRRQRQPRRTAADPATHVGTGRPGRLPGDWPFSCSRCTVHRRTGRAAPNSPRPTRTSLPSAGAAGRRRREGAEPDVVRHRAQGEDHERPHERGRESAVDQRRAEAAGAEDRGAGRKAQHHFPTPARETALRALIARSPCPRRPVKGDR